MCVALQNWLKSVGVNISTRFHKTENEKLRIISCKKEDRCTKFKTILYAYNHKTKHNSTKRTPADIFLYAGTPDFNTMIMGLTRNIGKLHW